MGPNQLVPSPFWLVATFIPLFPPHQIFHPTLPRLRQLFCHISSCPLCLVDPVPQPESPSCPGPPRHPVLARRDAQSDHSSKKSWSRHLFLSLSQPCHKMYASSRRHTAGSFTAQVPQSFIDVATYTCTQSSIWVYLTTHYSEVRSCSK